MRLLIKHRYTHFDPETGQKLETKFGMTAEAAAGSRMVKPRVIDDSRTEHYVSDSPTDAGFPKHRAYV
jgi:hypothetical protein